MLKGQTFYHGVMRKTIVAFGSLFSNIKIERKLKSNEGSRVDGEFTQTVDVPIAYAPKEKWIVRVDSDPTLENQVYTTLPRLSFEVTNIAYDATRKVNRMNKLICVKDTGGRDQMFSPVPYNIDISLYAISKTQEDCLQIVEQILPYFTPEFTLSLNVVPEMNIVQDIPIILNSVSIQDDYDGDFQTRRFVTYTMTFTLKLNLFGPISKNGVIRTVSASLFQTNELDIESSTYEATQLTPSSPIIEGWE